MPLYRPSRRQLIKQVPAAALVAAWPAALRSQGVTELTNFLVIGDWGRNGHAFQRLVAERMTKTACEKGSAFVASTGDNFYSRGVSSPNDKQWRTSFEDIYTDSALQKTWHAVLGNHDYGGRVEAQIERTGQGRWHMPGRWFAVPGAAPGLDLFFIDTVTWQGKEAFPWKWLGSKITKGHQNQQLEWLIDALATSTAHHKIVVGHHGIYSIGPHGGSMRLKELDDVLRAYDVTAYVSGHDHCLYHIARAGMHYICSGGGSEVLATYTGGKEYQCVFDVFCDQRSPAPVALPRWYTFLQQAGFASFTVNATGISFELIGVSGPEEKVYCAQIA
jgi:hypothetical protein